MENTKIQWCDATFNPWIGCAKKIVEIDGKSTIDPACVHCYAEDMMDRRYHRVKWGKGQLRQRTSENYWREPLKWNKKAAEQGIRLRVFCASLADWLDDDNVPIEWLADLLLLIDSTPNLDWLLLSKRVELWEERMHQVVQQTHDGADTIASAWLDGDAPQNTWMGATVTTAQTATERIPLLMQTPAAVRFLSCEPLSEEVNLEPWLSNGIDWVIVGGESGNNARQCYLSWIQKIVQQCLAVDVSVHVKQMGSNPIFYDGLPYFDMTDRKGGNIEEFPKDLQVRQFPVAVGELV